MSGPLLRQRWFRVWAGATLVLLVVAPLGLALGIPGVALTGLLVGAATAPLAFLVALEQRTGAVSSARPHRAVMALSFVVGGGVAVALSIVLAPEGESTLGINLYTLTVGPIEEAAKLVVPVLVWWLVPRLDTRARLVMAVLAAAGFQVLENLVFALGTALTVSPLASVFVLASRGMIGLFMHPMWTAAIAAGWLAVPARWRASRVRRGAWRAGVFAAVAATHSAWDLSTTADRQLVGAAGVLAMLITTLVLYRVMTRPLVVPTR